MGKIFFVSGSLIRGGAQRVLTLLANAYAQRGWEVHIVLLLRGEPGYPLEDSIQLHDLTQKGSYYKNVFRWVAALRALLRQERPDAVVSFAGRVNLITLLAAAGTGIPVLVSERNDPAHDRRSGLERRLCKLFYGRADCVVFQTEYQRRYYGKRCGHNACVIGNPISAPVYRGEHPSGDILSVGKLMAQKNHPMLIRAFAAIAARHPDTRVHIFGEGAQREELQTLINGLGLHGRVLLEGSSDQIFAQMREHRYFVMTSDYEGLSNALLEAMLSGMTCVSTAWNGIEDFAQDGKALWLVPVGDVDALAALLDEVLSGQRPDLRPAGFAAAERYRAENVLEQWFQAVEQMIK